jgi:hypothetical protein
MMVIRRTPFVSKKTRTMTDPGKFQGDIPGDIQGDIPGDVQGGFPRDIQGGFPGNVSGVLNRQNRAGYPALRRRLR